jgi:RimJ/RimL family protein N-acetyltransferase
MKSLQTPRLILRQWQDSDIPTFIAMNQDPQVMEFFPDLWDEKKSREAVEKTREEFARNGFGKFALELKESGEFIGYVGLAEVNFDSHFTPAIEIGWRLASQHFGRGYATEAAREVLRFAFEELHLKEIVAFTIPQNSPSLNVMKKIGMTRDLNGDFFHPNIEPDHRFSHHLLYRAKNK